MHDREIIAAHWYECGFSYFVSLTSRSSNRRIDASRNRPHAAHRRHRLRMKALRLRRCPAGSVLVSSRYRRRPRIRSHRERLRHPADTPIYLFHAPDIQGSSRMSPDSDRASQLLLVLESEFETTRTDATAGQHDCGQQGYREHEKQVSLQHGRFVLYEVEEWQEYTCRRTCSSIITACRRRRLPRSLHCGRRNVRRACRQLTRAYRPPRYFRRTVHPIGR